MRLPLLLRALALLSAVALPAAAPAQDLRGHGGPVRALAVTAEGRHAISGSFDTSAILWSLADGSALAVMRFHEGSVNAVAALPDGRLVTAGEDGRVIFWSADGQDLVHATRVHGAPIVGLVASADGATLATAAWDGEARLLDARDGRTLRTLLGHKGNVNAVAFLPEGRVATAGYDGDVLIHEPSGPARRVETGSPLNSMVALPDGRLAAGGAGGQVFFIDPAEGALTDLQAAEAPIIALAAAPDGRTIAAAGPRGGVAIIDTGERRLKFTLNGPGLPVWSLAFSPDGRTLYSGGGDKLVRRWDARTGDHLGSLLPERPPSDLAGLGDSRGAEVFKACAVCHTLRPDDGARAGPTLHGVFGRRAGTAAGYNYSEAFRKLDIVWTPETVSKLFEVGPQTYTPGTKMPEQTVGDAADRAALVDFL
ncbi:MAG TPA: c-type cytochrome, partial [Beijerinckiaceae bacterium]